MADYVPAAGLSNLLSAATVAQFATMNAQYGITAAGTAGNTVSELSLMGTGVGSATIAANALTAGKGIYVIAWGFMSATGVPTLTIKLKIGGVTIATTGTITMTTTTGTCQWQVTGIITCRTTGAGGTGFAQAQFQWFSSTAGSNIDQMPNNATFSLNTTTANAIDLTGQWSIADPLNTISSSNIIVALLG